MPQPTNTTKATGITPTIMPVFTQTPNKRQVTATVLQTSPTQEIPIAQGWLVFQILLKDGTIALATTRADGEGYQLLFSSYRYFPEEPKWSPDGEWIAYSIGGFTQTYPNFNNIYLMHPDGTDNHRLTDTMDFKDYTWLPNSQDLIYGSRTYFPYNSDGRKEVSWNGLKLVNIKTGGVGKYLPMESAIWSPLLSPDGTKLAFLSPQKDQSGFELMIMNVENSLIGSVSNLEVMGFDWSPDGKELIISVDDSGCQSIYILSADGASLKKLTDMKMEQIHPSWSPDGEWISFVAVPTCGQGSGKIYFIRPDGSGLHELVTQSGHSSNPDWFPYPQINVGNKYAITESGDGQKLRVNASQDGEILKILKKGNKILIVEGPKQINEQLWWYVRLLENNLEGWILEVPGWYNEQR